MVTVRRTTLLIFAVLLISLVPLAFAQTNKGDTNFPYSESFLWFTDVDVEICGLNGCDDDKDMFNGDKIAEEASPGATVEFRLELTNVYDLLHGNEDVEIEDIEAEIVIEGIDDDDDLDMHVAFDDLDSGDDDVAIIIFELPLEIEEDTFDVVIEADGDSDNGSQQAWMRLELEVEKEADDVRFLRNKLDVSEITCDRTVNLETEILNVGSDAQDEAELSVSNTDLGINFRETFDLDNDPFDDDSRYSKTFSFTLLDTVPAGVYPIEPELTFGDGREKETEVVELIVNECIEPPYLRITNVEAVVDGESDDNLKDGDLLSDKAKPGSEVSFIIELENVFTHQMGIIIEDVELRASILDIDDGDDLDVDAPGFILVPKETQTYAVYFDIPYIAVDGQYVVVISVEGETANNGTLTDSMELTLEVDRKTHEIVMLGNGISPSEITCGGAVGHAFGLINTGSSNEEGIEVTVTNSQLGINAFETLNLSSDPFAPDSASILFYEHEIPNGTASGAYPIVTEVRYNNGFNIESQTLNLVVNGCVERQFMTISDLDVKVDGSSDKNLDDGDTISKEAEPGSTVKFDIEVSNHYTDEEDVEIEDVEVTVTIEGIDDDDDLEEEAKEFDLDADDKDDVSLTFDIPYEVDADEYDVIIEVEGKDENGNKHSIEWKLELEVEKEDDKVMFTRADISPSEITCSGTVRLNAALLNIGDDEQEDVEIKLFNSELGIDIVEDGIELDTGVDDDASYSISKTFTVDKVGTHELELQSFYDGSLGDTKLFTLVVNGCKSAEESLEETKDQAADVQVQKPSTTENTQTAQTNQNQITSATVTKTGSEDKATLLLIIAVGILVLLVILGLFYLFLK